MVNAKELIDKGHFFFDEGKYEEAVKNYSRALNIEPENIDALINIGLAYRHLEKYDKAIEYYDKVLEIESNNKVAINNIGWSLQCKGELEKAIEMYKKSLEIDCAYDVPIVNLTNIYFKEKQYDEAIQVFKRALEKDPLNTANWVDLGRAYRYLEKYDDAIDAYLKALKLDKNDKIAWNNLGWVYFSTNQYDKAIEAYIKSLEIDWLYDLAFSNLIKVYKAMIKNNCDDSLLWKDIANGFYIAKAYKRAVDSCNRALEINPKFDDVIKLHKKIVRIKTKFDMTPLLLEKINDAFQLFSTISNSFLLTDMIGYIKYKTPSLAFTDDEIKFKIFETIKSKRVNVRLDGDKLFFFKEPTDDSKIDYLK